MHCTDKRSTNKRSMRPMDLARATTFGNSPSSFWVSLAIFARNKTTVHLSRKTADGGLSFSSNKQLSLSHTTSSNQLWSRSSTSNNQSQQVLPSISPFSLPLLRDQPALHRSLQLTTTISASRHLSSLIGNQQLEARPLALSLFELSTHCHLPSPPIDLFLL